MAKWFNAEWKYRKRIKIDHNKIDGKEHLINFPVKISKTDNNFARFAHPKGWDFLFTSSDGITQLNHEIQHWDKANGKLIAYVKIPSVSPFEDTIFYIYYGNPNASNQENGNVWEAYEFRKSFQRNTYANTQDNIKHNNSKIIDFLTAQIKILESLFGDAWFSDKKREIDFHPAYERWKLCKYLLFRKGRFRFPQDESLLPIFCKVLLENYSFIQCTKGNLQTFSFGSLGNYGDSAVQKRIQSEIRTSGGYKSIHTELQFAAWHLSHGHNVEAFERKGPDQKILIPTWNLPIIAECKRIESETKISRIQEIIKNANRQIKNEHIPCYGIIVIDLSEKIINYNKLNDDLPTELNEIFEEIVKKLYKYYTSISAALLFWHQVTIMKPDQYCPGKGISIFLRTQSKFIKHKNPLYPINNDLSKINFGNCFESHISLS